MASQINKSETQETKKNEEKKAPKRGVKNPFVYGGTIVILIITIIAFVFIPSISTGVSSGSAPSFGSWKGKPITYTADSYFANQVAQINEYLRQQGMSDQNFQYYAFQVWQMAFQSTAVRTALIDIVKQSGFRVTEKGLDEAVATNAAYQQDGKFSVEKFNSTPLATKLSIRNTTREDLFVKRYYEDIYTIAPSTAEIAFVASMAKPQRSIEYTAISLADYPDAEAAAWGAKNADLFKTVGLSRITITTSEADAKKVLAQVKENKLSFEDAAKSHSKDSYADKGGDAGTVLYYVFEKDFTNKEDAKKIASLPKGEVSDVYKLGDKVWAFFKVNSELAPADFTKKAVLDEVKAYIYEKERGTLESWAIAKANSSLNLTDPAAFAASAKKANMALKKAGPFIINIGNPTFYAYGQQIPLLQGPYANNDPALDGAEQDEAFMTELFSAPKGKVSKPIVLGDSVVVFSVTDDTPATDDETALVKFAFPYFHQQVVDNQTRDTILKSKNLKDEFNKMFFKIYSTQASAKK